MQDVSVFVLRQIQLDVVVSSAGYVFLAKFLRVPLQVVVSALLAEFATLCSIGLVHERVEIADAAPNPGTLASLGSLSIHGLSEQVLAGLGDVSLPRHSRLLPQVFPQLQKGVGLSTRHVWPGQVSAWPLRIRREHCPGFGAHGPLISSHARHHKIDLWIE